MLIASTLLISCIIGDARAEIQGKADDERNLFQAIDVVFQHCRKIEAVTRQPYKMVEAYQNHYSDADFDRKMTDSQRLDLFDYFAGRKDLPDFRFLVPSYQSLMPRVERVKFNAILGSKLLKKLRFESSVAPFDGNCIAQDFERIEGAEAELVVPLAFATERRDLRYFLSRNGADWVISDLQIGDEKTLADEYGNTLTQQISQGGFAGLIENLCNDSDFSKLGCEE